MSDQGAGSPEIPNAGEGLPQARRGLATGSEGEPDQNAQTEHERSRMP